MASQHRRQSATGVPPAPASQREGARASTRRWSPLQQPAGRAGRAPLQHSDAALRERQRHVLHKLVQALHVRRARGDGVGTAAPPQHDRQVSAQRQALRAGGGGRRGGARASASGLRRAQLSRAQHSSGGGGPSSQHSPRSRAAPPQPSRRSQPPRTASDRSLRPPGSGTPATHCSSAAPSRRAASPSSASCGAAGGCGVGAARASMRARSVIQLASQFRNHGTGSQQQGCLQLPLAALQAPCLPTHPPLRPRAPAGPRRRRAPPCRGPSPPRRPAPRGRPSVA